MVVGSIWLNGQVNQKRKIPRNQAQIYQVEYCSNSRIVKASNLEEIRRQQRLRSVKGDLQRRRGIRNKDKKFSIT